MFLLKNCIKNYAWGSFDAIARLQQRPPAHLPEAELWIGAHSQGCSRIESPEGEASLQAVLGADPAAYLGPRVASTWGGELPYLLKIVAAAQPLSIQVHPDSEGAKRGFAAENQANIALDSPTRNFKDPNPKPEIVSALTPFEALVGFRPHDELAAIELPVASYAPFVASPSTTTLGALLAELFSLPAAIVSQCAQDLADKAPWLVHLARYYPADPGLLVAALMNYVRLDCGQAVFLEPGVIHAYMSGVAVEVTANSDNVLRAGLTPKHVDRQALTAHCELHRAAPRVLTPPRYQSDEPRFELCRWQLTEGEHRAPITGPEIWFCADGEFAFRTPKNELVVTSGQSVFVPFSDRELVVRGRGLLFEVRVPLDVL